MNINMG